ncbi:hypothetical protein BMR05_16320 [Methylococcaceae bacterium HT4]|nr:hypothetical protein BMR05_16320 [Methylococcaceae bacterium HT4]TXL16534.1 hypothetical protein BMR06_15680 [Methylococcaceae bacterium HT5]
MTTFTGRRLVREKGGRQLVGERLRTGLNFTLTPIIFGGVSVSGVEVVVETIQGGGFKYLFTVNEVLGSGETAEFGFIPGIPGTKNLIHGRQQYHLMLRIEISITTQ